MDRSSLLPSHFYLNKEINWRVLRIPMNILKHHLFLFYTPISYPKYTHWISCLVVIDSKSINKSPTVCKTRHIYFVRLPVSFTNNNTWWLGKVAGSDLTNTKLRIKKLLYVHLHTSIYTAWHENFNIYNKHL
jgi:hypothetical protein